MKNVEIKPDKQSAGDISADRRMLEMLVCPKTGQTLRYDANAQELISQMAGLAYPIRNGIPIMLDSEARILD